MEDPKISLDELIMKFITEKSTFLLLAHKEATVNERGEAAPPEE